MPPKAEEPDAETAKKVTPKAVPKADPKVEPKAEPKAEAKTESKAAPRRGPGRPPTKPPAPPLERKGIVDTPKDPDHRFEFVHDDPMVFKLLFAYFKNIKARDIHIHCMPRGLVFFTRDHEKLSRVVAVAAGEHVVWHYCDQPFWIGLNREAVEKIFSSIDKTLYKITIVQRYDDPDHISIIFKDAEIDKECHYTILLSTFQPDEDLYDAEAALAPAELATKYPIKFSLTAKQFKKTVVDVRNHSDALNIEKPYGHPLQFTCGKASLCYSEVYRDAAKIGLCSTMPAGQNFRCTVKVANIRSLAASMVTDDVQVLCREDGDLLMKSATDTKALTISTLLKLE